MQRTTWGLVFLACSLAFGASLTAAPSAVEYRLLKKITLGGEGGSDHIVVDPATRRVFISRRTHVLVVDADGNKVGDIPNTQGVHYVALAPEFGRGFTSNGTSNSVTIFDLRTLGTIDEVKLPPPVQGPDGLLYDPGSKRVFTFNFDTQDVTAIDPKTGNVLGNISLGGHPESAETDRKGHVFVTIVDKNQIEELDSKALKVLNAWPLSGCISPHGLAIDIAHKRLFAGCNKSQNMVVVNSSTGTVVATVPVGQDADDNSFDAVTGDAFTSCGDGTITVTHEDSSDKYTVIQTIKTQLRARDMTIDPKTHNVYTVASDLANGITTDNPSFSLLIYGR